MKKIAVATGLGFAAAMGTSNVSAQQVFFTGFEGGIDDTWTQIEPVANSGVTFEGKIVQLVLRTQVTILLNALLQSTVVQQPAFKFH